MNPEQKPLTLQNTSPNNQNQEQPMNAMLNGRPLIGGEGILGTEYATGVGTAYAMRSVGSIIIVFLILFGLVFGGAGFFLTRSLRVPAGYSRTTGKVIQLIPHFTTSHGTTRSSTTYEPVIQFSVKGTSYTFTEHVSSNPPEANVGQTVGVAYNPIDPARSPKNTSMSVAKILGPAFMIIGVASVILGSYIFFKRRAQ